MPTLVRRVDATEAGLERERRQALGFAFLPGRAVDEAGNLYARRLRNIGDGRRRAPSFRRTREDGEATRDPLRSVQGNLRLLIGLDGRILAMSTAPSRRSRSPRRGSSTSETLQQEGAQEPFYLTLAGWNRSTCASELRWLPHPLRAMSK